MGCKLTLLLALKRATLRVTEHASCVEKMSADQSKHIIVSAMRDEAVTLIEWLAHHFAVGFEEIYVFTNDCRDRTKDILVALSRHFPVYHFDNDPPYKAGTIQSEALRRARHHKSISQADWLLHIDADEYLNVTVGDRKVADVTSLHANADAIAIAWKFFGNAGKAKWDRDLRSLRQFVRCESTPELGRANFKTIFRPLRFKLYSVHSPKFPVDAENLRVANAVGREMPHKNILTKRGSGYPIEDITLATWDNSRLHHYHVRPDELHRAKFARGDANGRRKKKRLIGSEYYNSANRNEAEDTSILFYAEQTEQLMRQMREVDGVREMERESIDWVLNTYS